jgi:hypothetical protein
VRALLYGLGYRDILLLRRIRAASVFFAGDLGDLSMVLFANAASGAIDGSIELFCLIAFAE